MNSNDLQYKYLREATHLKLPDSFCGEVKWQSPSNIALVKYWGKYGVQLPKNPSISFTLQNARTETKITFSKQKSFALSFLFEGKEEPLFGEKIHDFLMGIMNYFPFLNQLKLTIDSKNTFPHSSGIASSASSMSALIMCLLDIENQILGKEEMDLQKASYFSRLGSGSASRSIFPKAALWGETNFLKESSNQFAIGLDTILHPNFQNYCDSILIISKKEKTTSSRAGHLLMNDNPYAFVRYEVAKQNVNNLFEILKSGNYDDFIPIVESEAMQLHALMMCSTPSVVLIQHNTLKVIDLVNSFRKETNIPLCFTLDAGPNVHLLYPETFKEKVQDFIKNELAPLCQQGVWIDDKMGVGATKI